MRQKVLLVVVAVVLVSGGVIAVRAWQSALARQSVIDQYVAHANQLKQTESGLSQAAVELKKALELAPECVPALLARGEVCLQLRMLKESIEHLRHAAELTEGSDHACALVWLGRALAERHRGTNDDADFRGAHNAFLEARQDPTWEADAMQGYATLFLEKGRNQDVDKALGVLDEFVKKYADHADAASVRELIEHLRHRPGAGG